MSYSARVRLQLSIGDTTYAVAAVGDRSLILQDHLSLPLPCRSVLTIDVNHRPHLYAIELRQINGKVVEYVDLTG